MSIHSHSWRTLCMQNQVFVSWENMVLTRFNPALISPFGILLKCIHFCTNITLWSVLIQILSEKIPYFWLHYPLLLVRSWLFIWLYCPGFARYEILDQTYVNVSRVRGLYRGFPRYSAGCGLARVSNGLVAEWGLAFRVPYPRVPYPQSAG